MASLQPEALFSPVLPSERLTLTLFDVDNKEDVDFVAMMFNEEMPPGSSPSGGDWTAKDIRRLTWSLMPKPSDTHGRLSKDVGIYLVRMGNDANGPRIGVVNLCRRTPAVPLDLGYMLKPEYRNRRYGTEAVGRVLKYFTEEFGIEEICIVTDEVNVPSIKMARRLGFVEGGWVTMDGSRAFTLVLPGMKELEGQEFTLFGDGEEP
ncbi:acyl-CoA N-acyltransferase [Trichoderma novae-zelandiae]